MPVAALLDITNPATVSWLQRRLSSVHREAGGEVTFFLDTGNTQHTPHYFAFSRPLHNPDLYKQHFVSACMEVAVYRYIYSIYNT